MKKISESLKYGLIGAVGMLVLIGSGYGVWQVVNSSKSKLDSLPAEEQDKENNQEEIVDQSENSGEMSDAESAAILRFDSWKSGGRSKGTEYG